MNQRMKQAKKAEKRTKRRLARRAPLSGRTACMHVIELCGAPRESEPDCPALTAWRAFVGGLAHEPSEDDRNIALLFVETTRPRETDRTLAVLLLIMDCIRSRVGLLEGEWITTSLIHAHTHYDGSGYRHRAVIALVERFLRFLYESVECLDHADFERLLALADDARLAIGEELRRPPVRIEPYCSSGEYRHLVERFRREAALEPRARELVPDALAALSGVLTACDRPLFFERLDPEVYALAVQSEPERPHAIMARRHLFAIWACFYRWLGAGGHIASDRAIELEQRLLRLVLCTASPTV